MKKENEEKIKEAKDAIEKAKESFLRNLKNSHLEEMF